MTHQKPHSAYRNTSHMVRKTHQIVMLYDGIIRYVKQAKQAIEDNDIETRYNALTSACDIINGLQLSLDFDNGGDIAQLLYDYYAAMDMRLLSVHQSNDAALLDLTIKHLRMMREAWEEIDHNMMLSEENEETDSVNKLQEAAEKSFQEQGDDEKVEHVYDARLSSQLTGQIASLNLTA